ncbi:unnamed protein product [Hermetia illucens]|uniref:Coiled-coil and C2 domain-containing protein 1-like n=1 Tax=Hermetia illucens TaxID=343691 RepID=A0A7R8UZJ1_HERIL|nr:coiled-coil and C2 domain-containing protein 1-like isoform X2 [Hermetia illucens]CAD7089481.1 unnamed protein product [Hermetia illucens]
MFARKKAQEPPKKRNRDLSQFGLFEIPDDFDPSGGADGDENDSDLEAELAAITSGGGSKPKPQPRKKEVIPQSDLDKMVAESLRDIGSDEELSDGDEDDPNLLGELQEITGEEVASTPPPAASPEQEKKEEILLPTTTASTIDLLKSRIAMYQAAEANAKAAGEAGRARRFNRGLKTLQDMLKQASAGRSINKDDIPPEVFVKKPESGGDEPAQPQPPPVPARAAPAPPPSTPPTSPPPAAPAPIIPTTIQRPENPNLPALLSRQHEYKVAALTAKKSGDTASAMEFVKIIKQFDLVIKAAKEGQEVDLSDMPPPPNELKEFLAKMQAAAEAPAAPEPTPPPPAAEEPAPAMQEPRTMLEALQQRLDKYKSVEAAAKAEGNSGKARRFGRIVKQYEDAIKLHKAGRPIPVDELPTPPGFGPLPTGDAPAPKPAAPTPAPAPQPKPAPSVPATPPRSTPSTPSPSKPSPPPKPAGSSHEGTTRMSGNQVGTTLQEKQMAILTQRQREFKLAAIEAKKAGEIEQAKEYLKIYKGFESVLNAASCGLPVDMNTLPIPPSQRDKLEDSFAFVSEGDCDPSEEGSDSDLAVRLEEQLVKQLMMCKNTRDHHKAMGDVAGMNRFENLALSVQKDLDMLRYAKRKNLSIPRFHYEQKSFNIVHCNTDLGENEVEIVLVRGIQYNVPNPKDVDTYVKVEFPYPQDDPFKTRSNLVKNTDSPDYDQTFKVEIQRSNRQCQRVFKRHAVKFEVYSRGGFLRSDILIGTVSVKLAPLETKCDIHESFDLMDGRKPVGGKLELKVRVRNPIVAKQIEHINEKWLILDS